MVASAGTGGVLSFSVSGNGDVHDGGWFAGYFVPMTGSVTVDHSLLHGASRGGDDLSRPHDSGTGLGRSTT